MEIPILSAPSESFKFVKGVSFHVISHTLFLTTTERYLHNIRAVATSANRGFRISECWHQALPIVQSSLRLEEDHDRRVEMAHLELSESDSLEHDFSFFSNIKHWHKMKLSNSFLCKTECWISKRFQLYTFGRLLDFKTL
jgi:hypothetical protein